MRDVPMIHPILLCGGSGSRLWPLSRQSLPKQFVKLLGGESLFQASARRFSGAGFRAPVIVTSDTFRFIASEQLASLNMAALTTLIEPEPRNTAAAVLSAALWLHRQDPDSVMLVAPSDHVIPDADTFRHAVEVALPAAMAGKIVTFGITPTSAETGYGYLQVSTREGQAAGEPQPLTGFIEKPARPRAEDMLKAGNYLWNAGIFLQSTRTILASFREHAADMLTAANAAVEEAVPDLCFLRLAPEPWAQLPSISIDYAIMEKATNIAVMPYQGNWSDLGSWNTVWQQATPDAHGNVLSDHALAINCQRSMLRSESEGLELVGIGLEDVVAIAMPDAVLVAKNSDAQRVREAVDILKARSANQATCFSHEHRPWGWYEILAIGKKFKVKRIVVKSGAALSLQSHNHRAEHWIVVQGTAKITVGHESGYLTEGESAYIGLGAVHRLENPGQEQLILIEVQTGPYLGEDDITRYEDIYARR